ncbi:hypothetical protein [Brevundimonas sp.]|uniref:hypothetical protein n=1 Tax=Brevundimonas sp. TaxID=1871086 RepID=UPI003D6D3EFA
MRAAPLILAALAAPLALGACATGKTHPTYQQELDKLSAECTARGGILSPTGSMTGRPQTDNVCKITGPATRIPQG